MTTLPNSPAARDVASVLHAQTNLRRHERIGPLILERGAGIRVYDDGGRDYIEAMAGLWCVGLGWGEERLVQAATRQMRQLAYSPTFTHRSFPALIELSERLLALAPVPMSKVYLASSGSEAVDSAIKFCWYAHAARGAPGRRKILARDRAYHGVSIASGSATGLPNIHRDWGLPLEFVVRLSNPHHWRMAEPGEDEASFVARLAAELEAVIAREGADTIAALIAEPVMGAGGVIVPPAGYFQALQPILKRHGIWLIADEVITGFGRTGEMFGTTTFGMAPDLITCAKQITSAYLPLSAVYVSDEIYQAMADASARIGVWGHGFTYSGHPVSCAVALETLAIYEERDLLGHVRRLAPVFQGELRRRFGDHPNVGEVRGVGLIAALDLVAGRDPRRFFPPEAGMGARLYAAGLEAGVIVRAIGDTIALCPPLVIDEGGIADLMERFERAFALVDWDSAAA